MLAVVSVIGLELILPFHDLAGTRGPKSLYLLWVWPIGAAIAAIVAGRRSRQRPSTAKAIRVARVGEFTGGLVLVLVLMIVGTLVVVGVSRDTPQHMNVGEAKPLTRP